MRTVGCIKLDKDQFARRQLVVILGGERNRLFGGAYLVYADWITARRLVGVGLDCGDGEAKEN
jgi:hypothetical protein